MSNEYPRKLDDKRVLVKLVASGEHSLCKDGLLILLAQLIDAAKLMEWVGSNRTDWCPLCKQGWECSKEDQRSRSLLHDHEHIIVAALNVIAAGAGSADLPDAISKLRIAVEAAEKEGTSGER
jgi:hypothetical protein